MDMGLKDKTAIVTGGAMGLGRAIALALGREGVKIAIADIAETEANKAVEELNADGVEALAVKTDVTKSDQVRAMVAAAVEGFGRIDILMNNAGIVGPQGPWVDLSEEDFDLVMAVNFKGVFLCVRYVLPHMIEQKSGKIIMTSSCAGKTGEQYNGVYSATKAAIWNMTHSLSKEVGKFGINVNSICPAAMDTELMEKVYRERAEYFGIQPDDLRRRIKGSYVVPGDLSVTDAANVAVFLASDRTSMMTGQGVNITGGIEMH